MAVGLSFTIIADVFSFALIAGAIVFAFMSVFNNLATMAGDICFTRMSGVMFFADRRIVYDV